jgi:hypothetical protein
MEVPQHSIPACPQLKATELWEMLRQLLLLRWNISSEVEALLTNGMRMGKAGVILMEAHQLQPLSLCILTLVQHSERAAAAACSGQLCGAALQNN